MPNNPEPQEKDKSKQDESSSLSTIGLVMAGASQIQIERKLKELRSPDFSKLFDDPQYLKLYGKKLEEIESLQKHYRSVSLEEDLERFRRVLKDAKSTQLATGEIRKNYQDRQSQELAQRIAAAHNILPEEAIALVNSAKNEVKPGENFESVLTQKINNHLRNASVATASVESVAAQINETNAQMKTTRQDTDNNIVSKKLEGTLAVAIDLSLSSQTREKIEEKIQKDKTISLNPWGKVDIKSSAKSLIPDKIIVGLDVWRSSLGTVVPDNEFRNLCEYASRATGHVLPTIEPSPPPQNPSVNIVPSGGLMKLFRTGGSGVVQGAAKVGTSFLGRLAAGTTLGGPVGTAVAVASTILPIEEIMGFIVLVIIGIILIPLFLLLGGSSMITPKL